MKTHALLKEGYLKTKELLTVLLRRERLYQRVIETEAASWSSWVSMPVSTRLWLWRNGFHSNEWLLYDFETYDADEYVSGVQRQRAARINEPWNGMVGNKLAFYWMMSPFEKHQTEVYGIVDNEQFHPVGEVTAGDSIADHYPADRTATSQDWVLEMLERDGSLVFKPVAGGGGSGVVTAAFDGENYYWNGDPVDERVVRRKVSELSDVLVTEHIDQTDLGDELYPKAVNTLRVVTFWDETTGEAFIPFALYRIGTERSAPVDNWSSGGLSVKVDRSDGTLSEATRYPHSGAVNWYSKHPDTGAQIEGRTVPRWNEIRERVLDFAEYYSYLPYLGWDVVPTEGGGFKVIEANDCTDVNLLQVHRPLLTDERTRRFYERHGVV